jgi:predicted O-methyltransferase YrrM
VNNWLFLYWQDFIAVAPKTLRQLFGEPWLFNLEKKPRHSSSRALAPFFPDVPLEHLEEYRLELILNEPFWKSLNDQMKIVRNRQEPMIANRREVLYVAVRLLKPEVMFETGVFDGVSSAFILQAMQMNAKGNLVAIDLPAVTTIEGSTQKMLETKLPPGKQPGWIVPEYLRARYRLELGDSKTLLPKLLQEYGQIDIFFHDSMHTFAHQMFEYITVWPYLRPGGLLLSDDISWSAAFHWFCKSHRTSYERSGPLGVTRR